MLFSLIFTALSVTPMEAQAACGNANIDKQNCESSFVRVYRQSAYDARARAQGDTAPGDALLALGDLRLAESVEEKTNSDTRLLLALTLLANNRWDEAFTAANGAIANYAIVRSKQHAAINAYCDAAGYFQLK